MNNEHGIWGTPEAHKALYGKLSDAGVLQQVELETIWLVRYSVICHWASGQDDSPAKSHWLSNVFSSEQAARDWITEHEAEYRALWVESEQAPRIGFVWEWLGMEVIEFVARPF